MDKSTATSIVVAVLLILVALLNLRIAAWFAVAFLLFYGATRLWKKRRDLQE